MLKSGSVSFALHQTKANNLHKYGITFMRSEVLMYEKIGEVCNQENKIITTKTSNQLFFTHLQGRWLVFLK